MSVFRRYFLEHISYVTNTISIALLLLEAVIIVIHRQFISPFIRPSSLQAAQA